MNGRLWRVNKKHAVLYFLRMPIAFFDLDKTLIARNSAVLWVRYEYKRGRVTHRQAVRALAVMTRYHFGGVDLQDALRESIATLKGTREDHLRERTVEFYQARVQHLYRPGAYTALQEHRARGDELVLLTSSTLYLAEQVRAQLALDASLCTQFEVNGSGEFTGRPVEPICFGEGKLAQARDYAESRGVPLADCYFYSDSMSDLPTLEAVGHHVVVNPDVRLKRRAHRLGWVIRDWGRPKKPVS